MAATGIRMTAEELERLPEDGYRYELVDGELVRMSPAGGWAGQIAGNVSLLLGMYVKQTGLGVVPAADTGFKLSVNPEVVRAPDASFVSRSRLGQERLPSGFVPFAPDLAVEVVSPSETAQDIQHKALDYLRAGSRLVWVVYPDSQTVAVYRSLTDIKVLQAQDTLDGGDVIPGFSCRVQELFQS